MRSNINEQELQCVDRKEPKIPSSLSLTHEKSCC